MRRTVLLALSIMILIVPLIANGLMLSSDKESFIAGEPVIIGLNGSYNLSAPVDVIVVDQSGVVSLVGYCLPPCKIIFNPQFQSVGDYEISAITDNETIASLNISFTDGRPAEEIGALIRKKTLREGESEDFEIQPARARGSFWVEDANGTILENLTKHEITGRAPGKYILKGLLNDKERSSYVSVAFTVVQDLNRILDKTTILLRDEEGHDIPARVRVLNRTERGAYEVEFTPEHATINRVIMKIPDTSQVARFRIGEGEVSGKFTQSYSIDPEEVNLTSAIISVVAKGTSLYKCKDWDFDSQECFGAWEFHKKIVPGSEYNITIGPDDPGFGELGNNWSVQSGTSSITNGNSFATAPISDINITRSFILFRQRMGNGDRYPDISAVYATFDDTDQIRFTREGSSSLVNIDWYVVEGSDIRVVNGTTDYNDSDVQKDEVIPVVNLSNSFVIASASCDDSVDDQWHETFWTGELLNQSALRLQRNTSGACDGTIGWFVVEMRDGSSVQTGTATLGSSSVETTASIQDVNMSSSFLYFTRRTDDSATGLAHTSVFGEMTNSTTLTFRRQTAAGQTDIHWFVVETVWANVQRGYYYTPTTGTITRNEPIGDVNLTRSFSLLSNDCTGAGESYARPHWTSMLTSETNLYLSRDYTGQSQNLSWEVVEFGEPAITVFWANEENNLGVGSLDGGNLTGNETVYSHGTNRNVSVECVAGNCSYILDEWVDGTDLAGGESATVGFICLNASPGVFSATFNLTSNLDQSADQYVVNCEILPPVTVFWNQTNLDIGGGNASGGSITSSLEIQSLGVNSNIMVACTYGNCSIFSSNWTNSTSLNDAESVLTTFTCDDTIPGSFSALFGVWSNEDTLPNEVVLTCEMIDITPPSQVNGLDNTSVGYTWITWSWTAPSESDFNHVEIWINGSFWVNTSSESVNITGLLPLTTYEIGTRTVDSSGNVNISWVNNTAATLENLAPAATLIAPANGSVSSLPWRLIEAEVTDPEDGTICVWVFGGISAPPSAENLVYSNCSFGNASTVSYNWTSPVLLPTAQTEVLWHFDKLREYGENDTFILDFAYNSHDRTCTTTCPSFIENGGKFAGGYHYNGLNQYWELNEQYFNDPFTQRVFQAWIKPEDTNGIQTIYEEGGATNGFALRLNGATLEFGTQTSDAIYIISTPYIDTSGWHFVTAQYDSGNMTLYVDGTLVNSTDTSADFTTIASHGNDGGLGATQGSDAFDNTAAQWYDGRIDEVRILNTPLSQLEVMQGYQLSINTTYYWRVGMSDSFNSAFGPIWSFNLANETVIWNSSSLNLGYGLPEDGNLTGNITLRSFGENENINVTCVSGNCSVIVDDWIDGSNLGHDAEQSVNFTCINISTGIFYAAFELISDQDSLPSEVNVTCEMLPPVFIVWNQTELNMFGWYSEGNATGLVDIHSSGFNANVSNWCSEGDCSSVSNDWVNGIDMPDGTSYSVNFSCSDAVPGSFNSTYLLTSYNDSVPHELSLVCIMTDRPPSSVLNLSDQDAGLSWIEWSWTNPTDMDFNHSEVWLNGSFVLNTSNEVLNMTGLAPSTAYVIQIMTVDDGGNINTSWVNDTAETLHNDLPEVTHLSPPHQSVGPNDYRDLAIEAYDTEAQLFCLRIYGDTAGSIVEEALLYSNCSFENASVISYNWTSPVLSPTAQTEVLWHFDKRSEYGENTTYVNDFTGNGFNRSCAGSSCPVFIENGGKFAGGYHYNGLNQYWQLTEQYFNDAFSTRVFQAWVKPEDTNGIQTIYEEGGATNGFALRLNGATLEFGTQTNQFIYITSTPYEDTAGWHFVTAQYDSGNMTLYIDGILLNSTDTSADYTTISGHGNEGGLGATESQDAFDASAGNYFAGKIDEVRFLNTPITSAEVMQDYHLADNSTYGWSGRAFDGFGWTNVSEWEFTVALVDVEVNDGNLSLSVPFPHDEENVTLFVEVFNNFASNISNLSVIFWDESLSLTIGNITIPYLPGGTSKTVNISFITHFGTMNITAIADPDDELDETFEVNNNASIQFAVVDVLGNESTLDGNLQDPHIYVDGTPLNASTDYDGLGNISIKNGSQLITYFYHNFSKDMLNITNITVRLDNLSVIIKVLNHQDLTLLVPLVDAKCNVKVCEGVGNMSECGDVSYVYPTPNLGFCGVVVNGTGAEDQEDLEDAMINSTSLTFNDTSLLEGSPVLVSVEVFNKGNTNLTDVLVMFWDNATGTQIGANQSIPLIGVGGSVSINVTWSSNIGTTLIWVLIDPDHTINETNESNNEIGKNISVSMWEVYFGNITGGLRLADSENRSEFEWTLTSLIGNIYVADSDNSIDWSKLWPLGLDLSNNTQNDDFEEVDSALGTSGYNDSVNRTFLNNGVPYDTESLSLFGRTLDAIRVVNSSINTNFKTGILWDSSDDDGDTEYTQDDEDLVMVSGINEDSLGGYGNYDYEIKVMALLDEYKGGDGTLYFYGELR